MESALKEIFDALNSRVKSHLFAAVVIFALIFNWKPVFFLFFSSVSISSKFVFFDANTDLWTLYVYPISAAIVFVLTAAFVNERFHRVVSKPVHRMKLRDLTLAEEREAQKFALRQVAERRYAAETRRLEQEALEQAKFDNRVQDEELRPEIAKNLQKQIDELRNRPVTNIDAGTFGESDVERISDSL